MKFKMNLQRHAGTSFNETTLSYKDDIAEYKLLDYLMEVPEIGGDPEKIEVTTLSDKNKKYIPGISDLGDLDFIFLFDNATAESNYRILKGLQDANKKCTYKIEYPDGSGHTFEAFVSVKVGGGGVNVAKTFTASMFLQSDITDVNPA